MTAKKAKKEISDVAATFGKIGGKASFKKLGKKGMSELGKKGAAARWPESEKDLSNNEKDNG